jgi:predicted ATPase
MKVRWDDISDKLSTSTLLPVFVVWAVLCTVALILVFAFMPSGTGRNRNGKAGTEATKVIGQHADAYIGNLSDLWFTPNGALIGSRRQGTRLEVYVWANPLDLQKVEKKDLDLRKLVDATPAYSSGAVDPTKLMHAIKQDGSAVAVGLADLVVSQNLTDGGAPAFQKQNDTISWVGYSNDRLILLYRNGTLESRDPGTFALRGSQATGLDDPEGLWTNGSIVLTAASTNNSFRVFDFAHPTEYAEGSYRYSRATQIQAGTLPNVDRLTLVLAISENGQLAYAAGGPAVTLLKPQPSNSGEPYPAARELATPGVTSKFTSGGTDLPVQNTAKPQASDAAPAQPSVELQAPGTVTQLAFSGEDLLAAGNFQGVHWLGKSEIADTPSNVSLLAARPESIAALSNGKLWVAAMSETPATVATETSAPPIYTRRWFILLVWAIVAGLPLWPLVLNALRNRIYPKATPVKDWTEDATKDDRPVLNLPYPPADLVKACASGECILYAGAGLSAPAGFPTLHTFVRDLTDWTIENGFVDEELGRSLRAALEQEEYRSVADNLGSQLEPHREKLQEYLRELFIKPVTPPPALKPLADIPFSGVLTTNFDRLLEDTYRAEQSPVFTLRDSDKLLEVLSKHGFFFLKLFGSLDQPETVMISPAQYEDATRRNFQFSQFMETLFFSRTLLFVGASLEGIEGYLRGISISKQNLRTHYAIVAVTDESWRTKALPLKSRYGIEVLPYTPAVGHPQLQAFLRHLADEVGAENERTKNDEAPTASLRKLVLTDIGPFDHLELEFNPRWNILLGDNGSGKSTILKAIAVSILGEDAKAYAGRMVRSGQQRGEISLSTERNTYRTIVTGTNGSSRVESIPGRAFESEGWLAMGFPPLRTVSWSRPKAPEAQTKGRPTPEDLLPLVIGDPDPRLDKLKQWIVNLDYWIKDARSRNEDPGQYERLLNEFFVVVGQLTKGVRVKFKEVNPQTNEVRITTDDGDLPLESLSQGMTSLIGWVGILLQRLYELYGDSDNPRGQYALVLMDEIDAHLHPAWQQTLVRRLADVFPKIQFIATTHSPLIVAGMNPDQILRFARDEEGNLMQMKVDEEMTLGRADQILTGDLFGLQTTFSLNDDLDKDMQDYHALLAKPERTEAEEIRFQKLRQSLRSRVPLASENPPEQKALALISELLKEQSGDGFDSTRTDLLARAESLLQEVGKKKL